MPWVPVWLDACQHEMLINGMGLKQKILLLDQLIMIMVMMIMMMVIMAIVIVGSAQN